MPFSTATIAVPHPARYLGLLTARLEQETPVEHAADGRATITFGQGTCVLTPARGLDVIAAAADGAALAGLRDILTRHLRRCADGEDLEITWTEPVSGADMQITDPVIGDYLLRHCTGPTASWASWSPPPGKPPARRRGCRPPRTRAPS